MFFGHQQFHNHCARLNHIDDCVSLYLCRRDTFVYTGDILRSYAHISGSITTWVNGMTISPLKLKIPRKTKTFVISNIATKEIEKQHPTQIVIHYCDT